MNKAGKFAVCLMASVMLASSAAPFDEAVSLFGTGTDTAVVYAAESSVKVLSTVGYGEGIYATWSSVSGASGYNVYVDGNKIDSMLI